MEYLIGFIIGCVVPFVVTIILVGRLGKDQARVAGRLNRKFDGLLKHFGIEVPADEEWQALARHPATKSRAVMAYREAHRVGFKEANDAVAAWMRDNGLEGKVDRLLKHFGVEVSPDEEWQALARNPATKITAIMTYREVKGVGLKEAKDAVEAWMSENGVG